MRPGNELMWSELLEKAKEYIHGLKIKDHITGQYRSVFDTKRSVAFQGFLVAIESVQGLYHDLVRNGPMKYLCTYKLSQDHIESFFGKVRQRRGPGNNPTVPHFKSSYKRLLIGAEISASRSANVLPPDKIKILNCQETSNFSRRARQNRMIHKEGDRSKIVRDFVYLSEVFSSCYHPIISNLNAFVRGVVGYIAGFVVQSRALHARRKCTVCRNALKDRSLDITNLGDYGRLISLKNVNNGLAVPTTDVVLVCALAEEAIRKSSPSGECPRPHAVSRSREDHIRDVVLKSIGAGAFTSLQCAVHSDNGSPADHITNLIYDICTTYYNIRTRHICHLFNDLNVSKAIRHKFSKLILFNNQ